eukprot:IDg16565t1
MRRCACRPVSPDTICTYTAFTLLPNAVRLQAGNMEIRRTAFLTAALLLVLAALARPTAGKFARDAFFTCLRPSTLAFPAGAPMHANLTALSFRNNHVRPAAIVRASTPEHVADAIRCARRAKSFVCVRSGGHSLVGKNLCAGVLIDVGPMRAVSVDKHGIATIGAGAN